MLKRITILLIVFLFALSSLCINVSAQGLSLSAKSAVLINAETNEIVYEKNAYERRGMASTTKIMTSLLAVESDKLDNNVTVKDGDVRVEGTSIGLKAGDRITLRTLVYGMLLESGNDAANVTATAISGSREKFVSLMNKRAKELGMTDTSFKNPSGLTEDGHYSTAYDMAILGSAAIKNSEFCSICSQTSIRVSYGTPEYERTFSNHNKFLNAFEGAFGIKTGFTKASGRCLVTAAERDGVTLVAVTLSAPDDWNDHKKLMEYGFDKVRVYKEEFNTENIKINVVGSDNKSVNVKLDTDLTYTSAEKLNTQKLVICENFLYSGVKKGDVVGAVKVYSTGGVLLCESKLVSTENAPMNFAEKEKANSLWEIIKKFCRS
ncbi:MAG: D-alanyl-D-alanine carboxypeptidase family protein [Acutalibacteraceae bacterium]